VPNRALAAVLAVFLLVPLIEVVQRRQSGDLSPQSRINAHFAERPSLTSALRLYPRYWPPLYPTLLWLAGRIGVTAERVNQLFFVLTLVLIALYSALHLAGVHSFLPVLLFAVGHYNYVNVYQYISETLFTFLSLALVLLLLRYRRTARGRDLALLALTGAALAATKYMALFWAIPLAALHMTLDAPGPLKRRMAHTAAFLAASALPVGAWMGLAYAESGYLTGSDRFAPRFAELTTFDKNVLFTGKTLLVDFASLEKYASHAVINAPYRPSAWEWAVAAVALAAVGATVLVVRSERAADAWPTPARLVAEFFAAYVVVLIALWTIGNNDPVYTRFLYPAYPFLVLLGFHAYAAVRARTASPWPRLPFQLLYALLLVTQAVRDYHAVALPLR
jgi:hypothetical protein